MPRLFTEFNNVGQGFILTLPVAPEYFGYQLHLLTSGPIREAFDEPSEPFKFSDLRRVPNSVHPDVARLSDWAESSLVFAPQPSRALHLSIAAAAARMGEMAKLDCRRSLESRL
jgi:hypothetical protein